MQPAKRIFYYVNTGHRVGLDRFRRASALIEALQDYDITLLTNDFRIASIARDYHFKKAVGIDVIRNISNIARRGDVLIFDSNEHNDLILADMEAFFDPLIRFSDDANGTIEGVFYPEKSLLPIASAFEKPLPKTLDVVLFFGDDDYEYDLLNWAKESAFHNVDLLLGFYFFIDAEQKLAPFFKKTHDEEHYFETISSAKLLLTCSYQAALEGALSGAKVVYFQRVDYDENYALNLDKLGITTLPMQPVTTAMIEAFQATLTPVAVTNGAPSVAKRLINRLA